MAIEAKQEQPNITIVQNPDEQIKQYRSFVEMAEEKTVITLLQKLLDEQLLEFITEYPSTQYTKAMTKLMTYITSYIQVYNLDVEDTDDMIVIREMCHQFMLKMTSHKRRRSHEIVNGASRQDTSVQVLNENKGVKKFLGIR